MPRPVREDVAQDQSKHKVLFYSARFIAIIITRRYFFQNPRVHGDGFRVYPVIGEVDPDTPRLKITKDDTMWLCSYHSVDDTMLAAIHSLGIDRERCIFVIKEGQERETEKSRSRLQIIKKYFGTVISPYPLEGYEGRWIRLPCLIWRYGIEIKDPEHNTETSQRPQPTSRAIWERILSSKRQQKTRMLSVFCSARLKRPQQRQRHRFVEALKDVMGDDVHVYGHSYGGKEGTPPFLANKADGLDPYRYTIALENNTIPHFWSEKIPDAYLGEAYPFYSGGSNLDDYFPAQAFTPIDIFDIEGSIKTIKDICYRSLLWEERYPYVLEAKRRVIEEYHLKNILRRIIEEGEFPYERTRVSHE